METDCIMVLGLEATYKSYFGMKIPINQLYSVSMEP